MRGDHANQLMNLHNLPIQNDEQDCVNAVIEIPMGDTNKYEFDPTLEVFRLNRALSSPVHYPGNYGFIPSTLGINRKPMAVLVLASAPSFTGCLIEVRPIGLFELEDQGTPEAKVIAVGKNSPRFKDIHELAQLPQHLLREIQAFFLTYKHLEEKYSVALDWYGVDQTWSAIRHAHQTYLDAAHRG